MRREGNIIWYDDVVVDRVYIDKEGGYSILPMKQGIKGYEQHKYDNNPRYGGSNGTYVDRYNGEYTPVEYTVTLRVVVNWEFKGEPCSRICKFDVTDTLEMPKRMTAQAKKRIEDELRSRKYAVSHEKGTRDWALHIV